MSWGFERGRIYNRKKDIHGVLGGSERSGIVTLSKHPLVIAITGEPGLQHGYGDRLREDGVFEYFGEGQIGDMQLVRGNRAIAEHSKDGKALLLFRKVARDGSLRFEGEWICENVVTRPAPDRTGAMRAALVFELRPIETVSQVEESAPPTGETTIEDLRAAAIEAASVGQVAGTSQRTVYARSRAVHAYVLRRADGRCEGCGSPAPFLRADGSPYLEPHHIRRVSDGGPDDIRFVIALCPNCHRRVHAGADGQDFNASLLQGMEKIEPSDLAPHRFS
ncbi:HNH endonuclease [Xanthobacter flavus]|uniref:HNH endonuclease n=1 Tax=Xanthobacter flavus TaxID=281 RepID=UPI003728893E